jgi:hypothetical protein
MNVFHLPFGVAISVPPGNPGAGAMNSELNEAIPQHHADAIESYLLALASAGVDLSDPRFGQALETAVESINNWVDAGRKAGLTY